MQRDSDSLAGAPMLGMVFTELLDMLEQRFSPELVDQVLGAAELPHGGAYTAVGYYPHAELQRILLALSAQTGLGEEELVRAFGEFLLKRFHQRYPQLFAGCGGLYDFLAGIDGHIHVEVRKLYPQAQLPRFELLERSARHVCLRYQSPRRMVALAEGLIRGAAVHFAEPQRISHRAADPAEPDTVLIDVRRID
jgi:hypothetical protein